MWGEWGGEVLQEWVWGIKEDQVVVETRGWGNYRVKGQVVDEGWCKDRSRGRG